MKDELTLEDVKACIAFKDETTRILFSSFCDIWYAMAKLEGKTDHEAADHALEKLGELVLNLSKNENDPASISFQ